MMNQTPSLPAFIDNLADAVFLVDRQGNVVYANQTAVLMYGFSGAADALRPLDCYHELLQFTHPDGRPVAPPERPLAMALAGEQFQSYRLLARTNRGRELVIESSGGPLRDERGAIMWGIAIDRDVTAQRRDELRCEVLASTAQAIVKERRLDAVLQIVLDATDRLLGTGRTISIWRLNQERQELELLTTSRVKPETLREFQRVPIDASMVSAKAARTGEIQLVEDIAATGDEFAMGRRIAAREGHRSLLSIPLRIGQRVVGVLTCAIQTPQPVLGRDVTTIATLGDIFAVSIENACLNEQIEASRREADASLQAMEAIIAAGMATTGLTDTLRALAQRMAEVAGAEAGTILLLDEPTGVLTVQAEFGIPEDLREGFQLRMGEGFAGRIAAEGRPLAIGDTTSDPLVLNPVLKRQGIKSMLGAPLVAEGRVIGVAHVGTRQLRQFGPGDVRRMEAMASVASLIIKQTALREQAQSGMARLAAILESVADAVLIADRNANIVDVNAAAMELLGLSEKREALRPIVEYQALFEARNAAGEPLTEEQLHLARTLRGEALRMQEARLRLRDGRQRIVQYSAAPVRDQRGEIVAAVIVARDVTAERRWMRQREIISRIGQALSRELDPDAMIETVIDQTLARLGADFVDVSLADPARGELYLVGHRGLRPETAQLLQHVHFGAPLLIAHAYASGQPQIAEDIDRLGADVPLAQLLSDMEGVRSLVAIPLRAAGYTIGALAYGTRSPRRFPPEEIETMTIVADMFGMAIENARLFSSSKQRTADLEDERQRREQFISVVAHELRAPMTILMGYSQLLGRWQTTPAETQQRAAAAIAAQTRRLNRLVSDLLDASRITAGHFEVRRAPCNLVPLARLVVEQQQATTNRHRIVLDLPDGDAAIECSCDADRLVQALTNLVSNAIKYAPEGGEVHVTLRRREGEVKVSVRDEGPGIPKELIPLLFQPYSRLFRERQVKGVGLGLYITRGIVEAHGGHIWVESEPGRGTTFYFTLPLR